jgi:hypothetical protein
MDAEAAARWPEIEARWREENRRERELLERRRRRTIIMCNTCRATTFTSILVLLTWLLMKVTHVGHAL